MVLIYKIYHLGSYLKLNCHVENMDSGNSWKGYHLSTFDELSNQTKSQVC